MGLGVGAISLASPLFERNYVSADRALRIRYANNFIFENIAASLKIPLFMRAQKREYFGDWVNYVGLIVLLLFAVGLLSLLISRRGRSLLKIEPVMASIAVTVLSLFLTMRVSSLAWRTIPQLPYMQFPFRWLVVATVGSCLLAGAAASTISRDFKLSFVIVGALLGMMYLNGNIDKKAINRASYDHQPFEEGLTVAEAQEYRTVWWNKELHEDGQLPPLAVTEGDATIEAIDENGARQSYRVDARSSAVLRFRQLFFPGWKARVDGRVTETRPNESGNMELTVEPGEHELNLSFEDTWPRTAGKVISVVSVLLLLAVAYFAKSVP
jgi:hypothetical protein